MLVKAGRTASSFAPQANDQGCIRQVLSGWDSGIQSLERTLLGTRTREEAVPCDHPQPPSNLEVIL